MVLSEKEDGDIEAYLYSRLHHSFEQNEDECIINPQMEIEKRKATNRVRYFGKMVESEQSTESTTQISYLIQMKSPLSGENSAQPNIQLHNRKRTYVTVEYEGDTTSETIKKLHTNKKRNSTTETHQVSLKDETLSNSTVSKRHKLSQDIDNSEIIDLCDDESSSVEILSTESSAVIEIGDEDVTVDFLIGSDLGSDNCTKPLNIHINRNPEEPVIISKTSPTQDSNDFLINTESKEQYNFSLHGNDFFAITELDTKPRNADCEQESMSTATDVSSAYLTNTYVFNEVEFPKEQTVTEANSKNIGDLIKSTIEVDETKQATMRKNKKKRKLNEIISEPTTPAIIETNDYTLFSVTKVHSRQTDNPTFWKITDSDRYGIRRPTKHCRLCKEFGHFQFKCPNRFSRILKCYLCGGTGHLEPRCPKKMCSSCGKTSRTFSTYCQHCIRFKNFRCQLCLMVGHSSSSCPDLWRRFHLTTSDGPLGQPPANLKLKPPQELWCSGCARFGHLEYCCSFFRSIWPPALSHIKCYQNSYQKDMKQCDSIMEQQEPEKMQFLGFPIQKIQAIKKMNKFHIFNSSPVHILQGFVIRELYQLGKLRHKEQHLIEMVKKDLKVNNCHYKTVNMILFGVYCLERGREKVDALKRCRISMKPNKKLSHFHRQQLYEAYSYVFGVAPHVDVNYFELVKQVEMGQFEYINL